MGRNFTTEEIRMLAQVERDMDAGKIPFVLWGGSRLTVNPTVMEELGLAAGQAVSDQIAGAILEGNLAACQADLMVARARKPKP